MAVVGLDARERANRRMLAKLAVAAALMFGFGFALVPFYRTLCEALGVNRLVRAEAPVNTQVDAGRWLTVEFDANAHGALALRALEKVVRVHPGALGQAVFELRNESTRAVTAQAIPSYGPREAARYFKKLECFCFTQQRLAPGETRRLPVAFVIEAGLPAEIHTVTLSYTVFEVEGSAGGSG